MKVVLLLCLLALSSSILVNKNVKRIVDLTTQLAKSKSEVTVENAGPGSAAVYEVAVDSISVDNLSYISVSQNGVKLPLKKVADGLYEATLGSPLAAGATTTLSVEMSFTHVLEPFPKSINQPDNQLVRVHSNAYFYSPYDTTEQTSAFKLGTTKVESFTPRSPSKNDGQSISYGPYSSIAAKTSARVTLHFENNSPFLTITSLKREIEVSHWGNIAVEEHYQMSHTGAKLRSQFSRLDFQRNPIGAPTAIKSFRTVLPASSRDVYYRDDIGNISTSNLRETEDANELEIRPRFPLFGGWNTKYYIGYNVPSYEMLGSNGNQYKLEVPFVDHSYDNMVVDSAELRVTLPEGCSDFEVAYPDYEITREADDLVKTYLDTFGRPVLVFTAWNLEESHIQNIEIYYKFNSLMLYREPLLVVNAFLIFFVLVIIIVRLDFSIAVDEDSEARQRVAYLVEELFNLVNKIKNTVSDEYVELLKGARNNKDAKAFKASKKELEVLYKQLLEECASVSKKIVSFAPTLTDRVSELTRREGERKSVIASVAALADKVQADKVSRSAYESQESAVLSKLYTAQSNIEDALAVL